MKIAVFEPYISGFGGAQKVISKYCAYLKLKGHNVEIFTQRYDKKNSYLEFNDIKINLIKPKMKNLSFVSFLRKFNGFDLYVSNDFPSNFISIFNKPSVWICYSPKREFYDLKKFYFNNSSIIKKLFLYMKCALFLRIDILSAKKTTVIFSISKNIKKRVQKYYNIYSNNMFKCGIDFKDYKEGRFENYFLCVSRLVKPKRVDLIIKSMSYIKNNNVKLYVVGVGTEYQKLRNLVQNSKNIKFFGGISDKKLMSLYANSCGVIYTPFDEDWGLVPLEAGASGKPTIGVNEGGLKEIIKDEVSGFLINQVSPQKIAEKIDFLVSNKKKAKRMGKEAKKISKKYDWNIILPEFNDNLLNHNLFQRK